MLSRPFAASASLGGSACVPRSVASFLRSLCFIVFVCSYKNERRVRHCSLAFRLRFVKRLGRFLEADSVAL